MAAFTEDELFSFLLGTWTPIYESSNVRIAHYDSETQTLTLGFGHPGNAPDYYEYANVSLEEAESFARASSKGHWRHVHLPKSRGNYRRAIRVE